MLQQFVDSIIKSRGDLTSVSAMQGWLLDQHRGMDAQNIRESLDRLPIKTTSKFEGVNTHEINQLVGLTLIKVESTSEEVKFWLPDGSYAKLYHEQD